ncbi:hypothetical protein Cfor_12218, partial [Coptotermes formosanus]
CCQQTCGVVSFPAVDPENVTGKVYWVNQAGDFPFVGMNTDGCTCTTCPIRAGNRQTYMYQANISKKSPPP